MWVAAWVDQGLGSLHLEHVGWTAPSFNEPNQTEHLLKSQRAALQPSLVLAQRRAEGADQKGWGCLAGLMVGMAALGVNMETLPPARAAQRLPSSEPRMLVEVAGTAGTSFFNESCCQNRGWALQEGWHGQGTAWRGTCATKATHLEQAVSVLRRWLHFSWSHVGI